MLDIVKLPQDRWRRLDGSGGDESLDGGVEGWVSG